VQYIDSHSHLDFPEFDRDRSAVIRRAGDLGVKKIVVSATTANRWHLISDLANNNPLIAAAYGLHPMFMAEHTDQHLDQLYSTLTRQGSVAVGEIGLDYFIPNPDKAAQLKLFIQQLEIANELRLPVIIHARKSLDIVLRELRKLPRLRGSIHSFSGSEQQARQAIDLGFYLGFGGPITYTRATKLRKLVSRLPLESILLESDAPDQPDSSHFGERNEPAYLPIIAQVIADLRGINQAEVAEQTFINAKHLFKL